jgi:hypothetical protein
MDSRPKRSRELDKTRAELWDWASDAWRQSGIVTDWVRFQINNLHDADGHELPDEAKLFLLGVLLQAYKPGNKKYLPKKLIRSQYRQDLPSCKSTFLKKKLAEMWKTSAYNIDQIVSPRTSRQTGKPRKS